MSSTTRGQQRPKKNGGNGHGNGHGQAPAVVALPHGRVPPHNLDAERSLLGGLLLDGAALRDVVHHVGAQDFYRDAHGKVFAAMLALLEDAQPIDLITVKARMVEIGSFEDAGGDEFLDLLDKIVPNAANLGYYAKIVREKSLSRRLIEATSAIGQLGFEQHGNFADLVQEARRRIDAVVDDGGGRRSRFTASYTRFTVEELNSEPPPQEFILWPYIPAESVSIISAPGGSNKTTLLTMMAAARAMGRRMFADLVPRQGETVILTTEDRRLHYLRRLVALREHLGAEYNARAVAERFHLLDMAGIPVRLIAAERGEQYIPTDEVEDLVDCIKRKAPKADHIVIETISRVTGGVESNASHTVLVNACERICLLAKVAVTLVGHVGQNVARSGIAGAYSSRGGSALSDNARSEMVLQPLTEKNRKLYAEHLELTEDDLKHTLVWTCPKANGVKPIDPRFLRRLSTRFGPILVDAEFSGSKKTAAASESKDEPRVRRLKKGESRTWPQLLRDIVACVDQARRPQSVNELKYTLGGKGSHYSEAIKELIGSGHIAKDSNDRLIPGTTTESVTGTGAAEAGSRSQFPYGSTVGGTEEGGEPSGRLLRLPFGNQGTDKGNREPVDNQVPPPTDEGAPK